MRPVSNRADDVGRVWSLSRALTYRSLDQLAARGYVHTVGEEPGIAGGNRTILAATRSGRAQLRKWLSTPVAHLRDLRSELLLKLIIADICGIDIDDMLDRQHTLIEADVGGDCRPGRSGRAGRRRRSVASGIVRCGPSIPHATASTPMTGDVRRITIAPAAATSITAAATA